MIVEDFLKIKEHLDLSEELALEIEFTHDEGFYYANKWSEQMGHHRPSVMIGIKNGYNRRLLVHECLHATGMEHEKPSTYRSDIKYDEFSAQMEKEIFDDSYTTLASLIRSGSWRDRSISSRL